MVHAINSTLGKSRLSGERELRPIDQRAHRRKPNVFDTLPDLLPQVAYRNCTISIRLSPEKGPPGAVKLCSALRNARRGSLQNRNLPPLGMRPHRTQ
jgi:hypothetical protein